MSRPRFAHLSVRTTYSLREGAIRPEELAAATRKLGMDAVAITDTNGLYGAVRFAQACARHDVKPIFGARLTVDASKGGRHTVTLLARTQDGYTNMCRILTAAHMRGERGDPCASFDDIGEHASGLYALLGPDSEPGRLAILGRFDEADALLRTWGGAL